MGTPKAALEWHGSTLLRRTVGILARVTDGPVVVVRAPGQELPALPPRRRGRRRPAGGPGPGAGAGRRAGRASPTGPRWPSSAPPTCRSCTPPSSGGCCARCAEAPTWGCRWRGGTRSRWPPPTAPALAPVAAKLVAEERLRPAFLFEQCAVSRLDEAALRDDPVLAALDPGLDSVVNVNEPDDYRAARARPGARGDHPAVRRRWPTATAARSTVRAATVAEAAAAAGVDAGRARGGGAERGPDHQGRPDAAGRRGHRVLPVRRRGRLSADAGRRLLRPGAGRGRQRRHRADAAAARRAAARLHRRRRARRLADAPPRPAAASTRWPRRRRWPSCSPRWSARR